MNLSSLSNDELIRYADATVDSLTSSDLEQELLTRFSRYSTDFEDLAQVVEEIQQEENFDIETLVRIMSVLSCAEITDPETIESAMSLYKKLSDVFGEGGIYVDVLTDVVNILNIVKDSQS